MFLQGVLLTALAVITTIENVRLEADNTETVELHYECKTVDETDEDRRKSPIVLLHDAGVDLHTWDGIQEVLALETGRKVCAVDLRNHGDSPWSKKATILMMTADLAQLLDKEKMQKVILLGHGMGGMIAAQYALRNANRVESIIVEDMRPNDLTFIGGIIYRALWGVLSKAIFKVPQGATVEDARKIVADTLRKNLAEISKTEKLDETTAKTLPITCSPFKNDYCSWKTNINDMRSAVNRWDFWPREIKGVSYENPALFIYGEKSAFSVRGNDWEIKRLFPKRRLFGIKGAAHNLHGTYRQFQDEVLEFLKTIN